MKRGRAWKGLLCIGIGLLLGMQALASRNTELFAAEVVAQDAITCDTTRCTLSIVYDKNKGTLMDQINANLDLIAEDISRKTIEYMYIFPNANSDVLSHAEWLDVRDNFIKNSSYTNPQNSKSYQVSVSYLYMKGIKVENDVLPDDAFFNMSFKQLELPAITTLTKDTLKGIQFSDLYLPETLTSADVDAFPLNDNGISAVLQYIHVKGDLSVLSQSLIKPKHTGLYVDTTLLTNTNQALLKDTNIERLSFRYGTKKVDVNLNTWFDVNAEQAHTFSKLMVSTSNDNMKSFYAEGFHNLSRVSFSQSTTIENVTIKDCGITSISDVILNASSLTNADISNNRIDFTEAKNAAIYDANVSNPNFNMNNQKPDLRMKTMRDVEVTQGDAAPTITPTFVYADGSDVDFANPPAWLDATYASTYKADITYKDSPTLDMSKAGTYTRTYYSPNGTSIGSVKIKVAASTTTKETPTISLSHTPSANITVDSELTFTATMGKTGSDDLNTSASVEFFDGAASLGSVPMANDTASLSKQKLTQGSHTIKAVYSGNSAFESVNTSTTINVQAAPNPNKQTQSVRFDATAITKTYGDDVFENPYTKSETASTGAISFESSDPSIASVDATSGKVTIHKAGEAVITISIAQDSVYQAATSFYTLTIDKKKITLNGLSIKDKVYDASVNAEIAGSFQANGILSSDQANVTIEAGSGEFADANAGTQKAILLKDFTLKGDASDCYTLELPTLTANITQKEAEIIIEDATRAIGEENPSFQYTITGLAGTETKDTILDFTPPTITTTATKDSAAGTYSIQASGASSKNYHFIYRKGNLIVQDKEPVTSKDYLVEGVKGNDDWYISDVIIKPTGEYTQIWDGAEWQKSITLQNGEHENIRFKLKKADGSESEEITIASLNIDTIAPTATNIKDGDIYLLNRLIGIHSGDVSSIKLDGKEIALKNDIELSIEDSGTHTMILTDKAGNTTTYTYQSKALQDYAKDLLAMTTATVNKQDYDTLTARKEELEALSKDTSYTPSAEQKAQLAQLQSHCEELLEALKAPAEGVQTGDTTSIRYVILISWICLFVCGYFYRKLKKIEK